MAKLVIATAAKVEIRWDFSAKASIGPLVKSRSSTAKMKMLKMLLPKRFPTAKSTAPIFTAAIETTISGKDVVVAINILPTKVWPKPVNSAIFSPTTGKKMQLKQQKKH
jgi:hypothetical protein